MSDKPFISWEAAVVWLQHQPDQQELVASCYFDPPPLRAAERFWQSPEWAETRTLFPAVAGRALDLGAGNGIASFALARDGWKTIAIEPDPSAVVGARAVQALNREGGLSISTLQGVGERLPFSDNSFDLVYARQVLHHAHHLENLCAEIHRVLKPGGRLVAARDHVISSPRHLNAFLKKHPLHRFYGGENAFLLRQYQGALARAGLRRVRLIGPFVSVINYAPFTLETLRDELAARLQAFPGGGLAARLLLNRRSLGLTLKLLSAVDPRPGRLFTFVFEKPGLPALEASRPRQALPGAAEVESIR